MIEDIRKNRCRSLSDGEIAVLLEDINDEMVGGQQMFRYLIDERKTPDGRGNMEQDRRMAKKEDGWSREVEVDDDKVFCIRL